MLQNPIQDLLDRILQSMHDTDEVEKLVCLAFSRGVVMGSQNVIDHFLSMVRDINDTGATKMDIGFLIEKLEEADKLNKQKTNHV